MKKYPLLLTLTACVLLAACQPRAARPSVGGDPLFADQVSFDSNSNALNIEDEVAQYTESQRQLINKLYEYYQKVAGIDLTVTSSTTTDKGAWTSQVTTQEQYSEGTIKAFVAQKNQQVGDQSFPTSTYYDGTTYYTQRPYAKWEKRENAMAPMLYVYIVRLLIEGHDKLEMVEGLDQPVLSKVLKDPEQLAQLASLLDLPMVISPDAAYDVKIEAFMNKETGQMVSASVSGTVTDKGATYPIDIRVQTTEQKDRTTVSVDTNAEVTALSLEGEQALENFKKGNPLDVVNAYQMQWGIRNHEKDDLWLWIANPWNGKMLAAAEGKVVDKKADNYRLIYNSQSYGKDSEDKVTSYGVVMEDFYRHFVTRFIDHYAELSQMPASEDGEEVTTVTFRESFDADSEGLKAAAGKFDVSNVIRDGAVYAIDYVVNNKTLQLEAVYIWSITEGEESISVVNTLHFAELNEFSPNLINQVVPKEYWQTVQ